MASGDTGGVETGEVIPQVKESPKLQSKDSPEKIIPATQIQAQPEGASKDEEINQLREELSLFTRQQDELKKPMHPFVEKVGQAAHTLGARLTSSERVRHMQTDVRKSIEGIRDRFGVRVDMSGINNDDIENGIASVEELTLPEAQHALKILQEELAKYPPSYIKFCNINKIRLVKGVMYHSENEEGQIEVDRGYGRAPREKPLIYLSTEQRKLGKYLPGVLQHVNPGAWENHYRVSIHHELFHKSDEAEQGRFRDWANNDRWAVLNTHNYDAYIGYPGLEDKNGPPALYMVGEHDGFARGYGASSPEEDRATIAEAIMVYPEYIKYRMLRDEVFYKKCLAVLESFHSRSEARMGRDFFDDVFDARRKSKIDETYWNERDETQWTPGLPIMVWLKDSKLKQNETWIKPL